MVERDRLHDVAHQQCDRAYEPPLAGSEPGEGAQAVGRQPERERSLLLERCGDREEQRCDECEDLGQKLGLYDSM